MSEFDKDLFFMKEILNSVENAIFVVDVEEGPTFRYRFLNAMHERLTGLKTDMVFGKTPLEISPYITEKTAIEVGEHYLDCFRQDHAIGYQESIPFLGIEKMWFTRLTPLRDGKGVIYRIIGSSVAIDEIRKLEKDLQKSHDLLQIAQEIAGIGSIEYDAKKGRLSMSAQSSKIFNFRLDQQAPTFDDIKGKIEKRDLAKVMGQLLDAIRQAGEFNFKYRIRLFMMSPEFQTTFLII